MGLTRLAAFIVQLLSAPRFGRLSLGSHDHYPREHNRRIPIDCNQNTKIFLII